MTREEAIKELNDHYDTTDEVWLDFPKLKEALDMAISSLSAEGEYIKKEDVIKVVQKYAVDEQDGSEEWRSRVNDYLCSVYQDVSELPTYSFPDREKGEWIAYDHGMGLVYLKCPFCGVIIDKRYVEHNFCGKCGAKLSGEKSGFER